MSKKLALGALAFGMVLLSGCGGGGSKKESITEQISKRDDVMIIHGAKGGFCELVAENLKTSNDPELEAKDFIIDTPPNTVNCATYNKTEGVNCEEDTLVNMLDIVDPQSEDTDIEFLEDPNKACVIGMNKK